MKTLNCKTEARRIEADALKERRPRLALVLPLTEGFTKSTKPVENHEPEKKKALYRSAGKGSRSKVFISSHSLLRGFYYCKSARGKGFMDAERAASGFKWNWYMHHHKTTPKVVLEWMKEHHHSFVSANTHHATNWWREKGSNHHGHAGNHPAEFSGGRIDNHIGSNTWNHNQGWESSSPIHNQAHTTHQSVPCAPIANDNRASGGNEGLNLYPGAWTQNDPRSSLQHLNHLDYSHSGTANTNHSPANQNSNPSGISFSGGVVPQSQSIPVISAPLSFGDAGMSASNDNDGGNASGNASSPARKNNPVSDISSGADVFVSGGAPTAMNHGANVTQNQGNRRAGGTNTGDSGIGSKAGEMNNPAAHSRQENPNLSSHSNLKVYRFKPRGYLSSFQKRVTQLKVAQGAAGLPQ